MNQSYQTVTVQLQAHTVLPDYTTPPEQQTWFAAFSNWMDIGPGQDVQLYATRWNVTVDEDNSNYVPYIRAVGYPGIGGPPCVAITATPTATSTPTPTAVVIDAQCGLQYHGNTAGAGSRWSDYGCVDNLWGPEHVFRFSVAGVESIWADVSSNSMPNMHTLVMSRELPPSGGCMADGNSVYYWNPPPGTYYLTVDSLNPDGGEYYLHLDCYPLETATPTPRPSKTPTSTPTATKWRLYLPLIILQPHE